MDKKPIKVLQIYNQCKNTTIPSQLFSKINYKYMDKYAVSWHKTDKGVEKSLCDEGIKFTSFGLNKIQFIQFTYKVFFLFKKINPSVIHVHHSYSAILSTIVFKIFFRGVAIITIHSDYSRYTIIQKISFLLTMLFSDSIISNSKNTHNLLPFFLKAKSTVIYNGVDLSEIQKIMKSKRRGEEGNVFNICTASRLVPLKSVLLIIKAFGMFKYRFNSMLIIIGDGPEIENLKSASSQLDCSNRIRFTGGIERSEVYKIMYNSTIYCSASQWEGFGNSIVEAMACGLPIVSSDIPAVREIVGDKGATYFPIGSDKKLSDIFESLFGNQAQLDMLSIKSLKQSKKYSLTESVERHVDLYNNLV
jgi:glycosyltransferase involved in cell wall biosynthesis